MLESLLCSGRPEYEGEDTSSYLSDQCDSKWPLEGYSVPEKRLLDDGGEISKRLADLRQEVSDAKVDWYIVPTEDEHQSEDIGPKDKRREYISGFTGTAGTALVPSSSQSGTKARLLVDSRYWIEAEEQVSKEDWEVVRLGGSGGRGSATVEGGLVDWVVRLEDGIRIGIDPKLISQSVVSSIEAQLEAASSGTRLIAIKHNLVDRIRTDPSPPAAPFFDYPLTFAGEDAPSKIGRIRETLTARVSQNVDWVYLIPALPVIAWLLNIRCEGDIPACPVGYAYVALTSKTCVIFTQEEKVDKELKKRFSDDGVELRAYGVDEVGKFVKEVNEASTRSDEKKRIKFWASRECSWALSEACKPVNLEVIACPIDAAKAIKNETELNGVRNAYLRDGRATVRWMSFLEQKIIKEQRPVGEWAAAQTLTRFRRQEENFKASTGTDISASGAHAALPHYAPERGKDSLLEAESPYLIDTGAHYLDGTIDTTRTMYLGNSPSPEIKRAYTRVLQSHMAVANAVFPEDMPSEWINMLAKQPLYEDGLDFGHGLGHGVGCYLSVHEYPISFPHGYSFRPGVVTTVEPGYYKEGEYGIRTESLYVCKAIEREGETSGKKWYGFDRITQVPIQTSLVDWSLMSKPQIRWLNEHNTAVQEALMPLLQEDQDAETRDWLKRACKPRKIWPWTGRKDA